MMNRTLLFVLLLCLGPVCEAQTAPPDPPTPQNAPLAAQPALAPGILGSLANSDLLIISASANVPSVCVSEIVNRPLNTLSFLSSPFCATYLALSSDQYQRAMKESDGKLRKQLFVQGRTLINQAYKSLSQQTGSSTGTGGSTNLASKGATAQFLAFASEFGGLTESTSGQTTTLSGTLAGVPLTLLKQGLIENCPTNLYRVLGKSDGCVAPRLIDTLSRISYSVGINSDTGNQTTSANVSPTSSGGTSVPATFANSGDTLSVTAVSAKWIALQGKPTTDAVTAAYKQVLQSGSQDFPHSVAMKLQQDEIAADAASLANFRANIVTKMRDAANKPGLASNDAAAAAVQAWKDSGTEFMTHFGLPANISPADAANSDLLVDVQEFAIAYAQSIGQQQAIGVAIARPAILTFEYDNNRPLSQPSNSVFRVIYQTKLGQVTLTANGAASIYDSTPSSSIPGSERLRDVQFAAEADRTFSPTIPIVGKTSMTGSGSFYFQDQTSPSILNVTPGMPVSGVSFTGLPSTATQVFAQKGNIAIGQAKLTFGSGSNLKVPISVTYSNRTELVTTPVWRGQIGISYDFDSLFTKK